MFIVYRYVNVHIYLNIAKTKQTAICGSVVIVERSLDSAQDDNFFNRLLFVHPTGKVEFYDKRHTFTLAGEHEVYSAGENKLIVEYKGWKICPLICYDLRFPELFRELSSHGANVITVPSAFTKVTGAAHWQVLLQSRAIENQVFIVAAGQSGTHANGRETWGHSMIVSPWGEILTCLPEESGCSSATFSLESLHKVRQSMPVQAHNQFITKLK